MSLPRIGDPFVVLETVDSTNNYATARIADGLAQHGFSVLAKRQTLGRGQRGKVWHTGEGNLAMSVVLQPAVPLHALFLISMAVALAVREVMQAYSSDPIKIKWPNDIYWRDRKAGGILIENKIQGTNLRWTIAGIGINVQQGDFGEVHPEPASIYTISGKKVDPEALAKDVCSALQTVWPLLAQPATLQEAYENHLYKRGEKQIFREGVRVFEGLIVGVSMQGALLVDCEGQEESFAVGEVVFLR